MSKLFPVVTPSLKYLYDTLCCSVLDSCAISHIWAATCFWNKWCTNANKHATQLKSANKKEPTTHYTNYLQCKWDFSFNHMCRPVLVVHNFTVTATVSGQLLLRTWRSGWKAYVEIINVPAISQTESVFKDEFCSLWPLKVVPER